ncbi:MAG: hypothetical protein NT051_04200 [Candidatus Micrarchaeota archaeon]|nr:hypothetical protein [Candidatus Micrarchaeota archaeon]
MQKPGGMRKLLASIERRYLNGETLHGPRPKFIFDELVRSGCRPVCDSSGNIWAEKGSGKPLVVFSSHMDVDPRIHRKELKKSRIGNRAVATGVLDNAVGCTLNLLLAQSEPKKGRRINVFTVSEEIRRDNPNLFEKSAREVVRTMKRRRIKPSLCVTIDVTYPRLLAPHHKTDWNKEHHEIVHMEDRTHCYLDGYFTRASRRIGAQLVKRFRNKKVKVRNLPGHDEAAVYRKISPSFAFGPVVFGSFDRPNQSMPISHMRTALKFLKSI